MYTCIVQSYRAKLSMMTNVFCPNGVLETFKPLVLDYQIPLLRVQLTGNLAILFNLFISLSYKIVGCISVLCSFNKDFDNLN